MKTVTKKSLLLELYSPYWFINRTGLDLCYRDPSVKDMEILHHGADYGKPFLFAFAKLASSKEKVCRTSFKASTLINMILFPYIMMILSF